MAYPIERKLVIAVSSSALFDLTEADQVFRREGEDAYRRWMRERREVTVPKGSAFAFASRFLALNEGFPTGEGPAEIVILSRSDPETGLRIFNSIRFYGLDIGRAAFLDGSEPYPYIPAFEAALFLSANPDDVKAAIRSGYPAGQILESQAEIGGGKGGPPEAGEEEGGRELRVAFDFDGVLASDESERRFRAAGDLASFAAEEERRAGLPLDPGPIKGFFQKLAALQELQRTDKAYSRSAPIRTAIVTARNAPAHERVIRTLESWGIRTDKVFFLGGVEKSRILSVMKPHLYFDDQLGHLEGAAGAYARVHVPFGIANVAR